MADVKPKKIYLKKSLLKTELIKSHEKGMMTNELCDMFYLLIDRLQRKLFYIDDDKRKDCRSHAMMVVVENWHKFDIEKSNPFAYFTRVVMNGLSQAYNRNEKRPIHISLNAFINNDEGKEE